MPRITTVSVAFPRHRPCRPLPKESQADLLTNLVLECPDDDGGGHCAKKRCPSHGSRCQPSRDRLQRGHPRGRCAAEESPSRARSSSCSSLENLKEAFGRDEPGEPSVGVDDGHTALPSPSRRSSGSLEVVSGGTTTASRRASDRSVKRRRQQPLDGDYAQEVAVGDNGDVGRVCRLPSRRGSDVHRRRVPRAQLVQRGRPWAHAPPHRRLPP